MVQWAVLRFPSWEIWGNCAVVGDASCIQPGVYGLIAAGATMCGVTRLSVTLAVILFESPGASTTCFPSPGHPRGKVDCRRHRASEHLCKMTALIPASSACGPANQSQDLLTEMNSYPYLNNKHKPIFTSELGDLVPRLRRQRVIDISSSPLVEASSLRTKLERLHKAGELDGAYPSYGRRARRPDPGADLEFALDNLNDEGTSLCLMASVPSSTTRMTEPRPNRFHTIHRPGNF